MTAATIDTGNTMEIGASPIKMVLMALGGLAFVVGGFYMSQASTGTSRHSVESVHFWGYASMAFFGAITALTVWRLVTQRGTVITLSPEGFRDIRVSADIVPWQAVASLKTWQSSGQNIMVIELHPGEEAKLKLTAIARMSRGANTKLGADGLSVAAQGTKIGHEALMEATIAYAERYGRG